MLEHILYSSATLIALTAPLVELPIFLTIMEGRSPAELRRAAFKVAVGAFVILCGSALAGTWVLRLFGVSLPAFRTAGGIVLVVIGLGMLRGESSPLLADRARAAEPEDQLWVPLVMPLTAGPAAITTAITLSIRDGERLLGLPIATLISIGISSLVVLTMLMSAVALGRSMTARAARIFERFFGLVLLAIGCQMGLTGVHQFFLGGS